MLYLKNSLVALVLTCGLSVTPGCVSTIQNPDGSVVVSEPDYDVIQLLATATISAWAATQKDGIKPQDAEALLAIMASIEQYHADGSAINPAAWTVEIQKQVPKRYQALAVVLVQVVASQLEKYGVADQIPTPDSVGGKVMRAIITGASLGLAPYLPSSSATIWEDRTVRTVEA